MKFTKEVLNDFLTWRKLEESLTFVHVDEPWIAQRSATGILVNTHTLAKCSHELFRVLAVSALVHVADQKLNSQADIDMLHTAFGDFAPLLLDIEADLVTAQYFHQVRGYSFDLLYDILFENLALAHSTSLNRDLRFERFVGSASSLSSYFATRSHVIIVPAIEGKGEEVHTLIGGKYTRRSSTSLLVNELKFLFSLDASTDRTNAVSRLRIVADALINDSLTPS